MPKSKIAHTLAQAYFKPKLFEVYKNKTIYQFIGISIYKKYVPSSGDLVMRWRKQKQLNPSKINKVNELYVYELKTRTYEWRHIIGILISIGLIFFINHKLTLTDWLLIFIINLVVNIYPIFLQRHNRIRIIEVLKKTNKQVHFIDLDNSTFGIFEANAKVKQLSAL